MTASPFSDTIYAHSSGALPSGVAVIRLSGPDVRAVLKGITGTDVAPKKMRHTRFRSQDGELIDSGLVVYFAAPASFTGEDCGELHLHGGRAVVAAMLAELGRWTNLRAAGAGEFTRRALANGKVDLLRAEALADLIDAETDTQRRFALDNADGRHGALYIGWRERILRARALIEAELDFSDEGDVASGVAADAWADVRLLADEVERHLAGYHQAEIIREGFRVAILGAPNAGKSSLLNALALRDVAIVSEEPGTTRDVVQVELDLRGLKVVFSDTAGLREEAGTIEREGMRRALAAARDADLVLWLSDLTGTGIDTARDAAPKHLHVGTKLDRLGNEHSVRPSTDVDISVVNGAGLDTLLGLIQEAASGAANQGGQLVPFTARHRDELARGLAALRAAEAKGALGTELRAEELRIASVALGRITGVIDVEDVLGAVFSRFCIGK